MPRVTNELSLRPTEEKEHQIEPDDITEINSTRHANANMAALASKLKSYATLGNTLLKASYYNV